jgi:glyoxylase-like metal-dependent hydrolase (beta-lactamase superfamily II)/predicted ester cyclase
MAETQTKAKPARKSREKKASAREAEKVVRGYFQACTDRDAVAMGSFWSPNGIENISGEPEMRGPAAVTEYFTKLFEAIPDARMEVREVVAQGDRVAVHWEMTGTFAGATFRGFEPTGSRLALSGIDLLHVGPDGKLLRNDAYMDGTEFARQLGALPALGSAGERRMAAAFNLRTRLLGRLFTHSIEPVADRVWLVRGDIKKAMNVYLIEDDGGVTVFDAGTKAMPSAIAAEAAKLGGVKRVVLGHGHADHRGAAPGLRAPVYCHPDEVADAESDGGLHYFDFSTLRAFAPGTLVAPRYVMPTLLRIWDGGPVQIEGTLSEGDHVAGFEVRHFPGHAPGLIGLWRESDRLALVSDTFYTTDPETGHPGPPRVPHPAYNKDTEQARESIRKLAAMEPAAAWPGHANPLTGDVRAQLEQAADTT